MHRRGELQRRVLLAATVMSLLAAHADKIARADLTTALVPVYTYPGTDPASWTQLDQSANQINVDAIVNPASGPGTITDPNYVAAIAALDATKYGKAFGYIKTGFGGQSLSAMEADVDAYRSLYGGQNFAGFFLDQMSINATTLSTYQAIYNYIKSIPGTSYTVIGNPGNPFIFPLTPDQVLSTADQLVIFEGPNTAPNPGDPGFNNYPYPGTGLTEWWQNYPSSRFANIIHDAPASSLLSDMSKAQGLNAGSIFVTDGTGGNPYNGLPSYWDQEVAALPSAAPEPSSLVLATVCGIVGSAAAALRSRRLAQRNGG
jgi:hypothetical protein